MSKRNTDPFNLSDALKAFVTENKLQDGIDKVDVENAWRNLMGNGVNKYTSNVTLQNDILYVQLTSSVLRQELSLGKTKIITMLNEALGKQLITKIILR